MLQKKYMLTHFVSPPWEQKLFILVAFLVTLLPPMKFGFNASVEQPFKSCLKINWFNLQEENQTRIFKFYCKPVGRGTQLFEWFEDIVYQKNVDKSWLRSIFRIKT